MLFKEDIIKFHINPKNKEELLSTLALDFVEKGVATKEFVTGVIKREEDFPTGLPVKPIGVAIPHTDNDKVIVEQLGFASLKDPISFRIMGSDEENVDVFLVFMLALKHPEQQLDMLQKLITLLQNESVLNELYKCTDKEEFKRIMGKNNII